MVEILASRASDEKRREIREFAEKISSRSAIERTAAGGDKMGVDTGFFAVNPVNGDRVPI